MTVVPGEKKQDSSLRAVAGRAEMETRRRDKATRKRLRIVASGDSEDASGSARPEYADTVTVVPGEREHDSSLRAVAGRAEIETRRRGKATRKRLRIVASGDSEDASGAPSETRLVAEPPCTSWSCDADSSGGEDAPASPSPEASYSSSCACTTCAARRRTRAATEDEADKELEKVGGIEEDAHMLREEQAAQKSAKPGKGGGGDGAGHAGK
jgi:hypothetical protein